MARRDDIAQLYVATFNRAPDAEGLAYWNDSGLTVDEIAASFFDQTETQEKYPDTLSNEDFINTIYNNVFNRDADAAGLEYWLAEMESGTPRNVMILTVINGVLDTDEGLDATTLNNKTFVGLEFADAGLNDVDDAIAVMAGVDETQASVVEAVEMINALGFDLTASLTALADAQAEEVAFLEENGFVDGAGNPVPTGPEDAHTAASTVTSGLVADAAGYMNGDQAVKDSMVATQNAVYDQQLAAEQKALADTDADIAKIDGLTQAVANRDAAIVNSDTANETLTEATDASEIEAVTWVASVQQEGNGPNASTGGPDADQIWLAVTGTNADASIPDMQYVIAELDDNGALVPTTEAVDTAGNPLAPWTPDQRAFVEAQQELAADYIADINAVKVATVGASSAADALNQANDDIADIAGDNPGDPVVALVGAHDAQTAAIIVTEDAIIALDEAVVAEAGARTVNEEYDVLVLATADAEEVLEDAGYNVQQLADAIPAVATAENDAFIPQLDGDTSIGLFGNLGEDSLFVGTEYTLNTTGLDSGDDSVLEVFLTQTVAGTVVSIETAPFGSSTTPDAEVNDIVLNGISMEDVSFEDGLIVV